MAEFDFDSLLEEVDTPVAPVKKVETKVEVSEEVEEPKEIEKEVVETVKEKEVKKINSYLSNLGEDELQAGKEYLKKMFDCQERIKEIREEIKEIKQEYKEVGVKTSLWDKAKKIKVEELKETSEDSQYLTRVMDYIEENTDLYSIVAMEADK